MSWNYSGTFSENIILFVCTVYFFFPIYISALSEKANEVRNVQEKRTRKYCLRYAYSRTVHSVMVTLSQNGKI